MPNQAATANRNQEDAMTRTADKKTARPELRTAEMATRFALDSTADIAKKIRTARRGITGLGDQARTYGTPLVARYEILSAIRASRTLIKELQVAAKEIGTVEVARHSELNETLAKMTRRHNREILAAGGRHRGPCTANGSKADCEWSKRRPCPKNVSWLVGTKALCPNHALDTAYKIQERELNT